MKHKDSGFVMKLLPVLLSTGMVLGLILLAGKFTDVLRIREEMNQIARMYLLEMESQGHLTNNEALQMKQRLEQKGLTSVSLAGTTTNVVDYGEPIQLSVSGELKIDLGVYIPFFYKEQQKWTIPVHIKMVSTAKH